MWGTWLSLSAFAGSVYVNGVNVDTLRGQTFDRVNVTIDANGNVLIDAPGYRIQVEGQPASAAPPPVISGPTPPVSPVPPQPASAPVSDVPAGRWWMVTEDNASFGHSVDLYVNNVLVQSVKSGEGQKILDLGPWLRRGSNAIRLTSRSVDASGGTFYVYVASGGNESGTVTINSPEVQYGLGSTRQGSYGREYTLQVP